MLLSVLILLISKFNHSKEEKRCSNNVPNNLVHNILVHTIFYTFWKFSNSSIKTFNTPKLKRERKIRKLKSNSGKESKHLNKTSKKLNIIRKKSIMKDSLTLLDSYLYQQRKLSNNSCLRRSCLCRLFKDTLTDIILHVQIIMVDSQKSLCLENFTSRNKCLIL